MDVFVYLSFPLTQNLSQITRQMLPQRLIKLKHTLDMIDLLQKGTF